MADAIDHLKLETSLRATTADLLLSDVAAYAIEGTLPAFAMRPRTQQEVADMLAVAEAAGAAVVTWGSGSQMGLGMPPTRYDVAMDLRDLDKVIEYEPADLTVTAEAGMALSKLQTILGERGQWLPLDPALPEGVTIGGVLATNASGPTRYRYGTARDLLIGITFALPNGELVKSGGRVVKNVAGYDLGKLQIGALGTLGVITQATFKVAPLPVIREMMAVVGSLGALMSIKTRLADSLLAVNGVELSKKASDKDWCLVVQFAGGAAAVNRSLLDFGTYASEAGASMSLISASTEMGPASEVSSVFARASVIPTNVASICESFAARGAGVMAYPTAGIVYGAWDDVKADVVQELRKLCVEDGRGALVLERAPLDLKRAAGVWGDARGDFELMRRIKAELDPKNVLNPGRYVGGL